MTYSNTLTENELSLLPPPPQEWLDEIEKMQVTEEEILEMTYNGTFTNKTQISKIKRNLSIDYPKKNSNEYKILSATIKKNKLILKVEDLIGENKGMIFTEKYTMKKLF